MHRSIPRIQTEGNLVSELGFGPWRKANEGAALNKGAAAGLRCGNHHIRLHAARS